MQRRAVILLIAALLIGGAAIYLIQMRIEGRVAEKVAELGKLPAGVAEGVAKVVVARVHLNFGEALTQEQIAEIDWPKSSVPEGAFTSSDQLLSGERRLVLQPMQPNEVILPGKITGPGERASLSSVIDADMRAVTIRVNDVWGVGGFVLPKDRVDVLLTREMNKDSHVTDIILQNAKVLGVDQIASEKPSEPVVVKSITIEVSPLQAQKLALATQLGTLSLALRRAGSAESITTTRIEMKDLGPTFREVSSKLKRQPQRAATSSLKSVTIIRGMDRMNYSVPREPTASPQS